MLIPAFNLSEEKNGKTIDNIYPQLFECKNLNRFLTKIL